ncbi:MULTISPECIES: hypothetical protein [Streptomyces]|uniref:Uncharacterized protein n=1 Tax=Streptomyces amritsarensis TaxID=681158 RepID=A0ABX3G9J6_9ACTN|nr:MULTISPECIES: hypothetical protein [Streptomyces]AQT70683.1 hypothetical protein B1K54_02125 [Streptomyces sp. fd1-xmd]OLZ69565.1 hypothetical protein AVW11_09745 [Streptomyces amritsarensis]
MEYVNLDAQVGDLSEVLDPARYLSHLSSISDDLPPGARAFATDTDHYDFRSRRCVKDLTLRAVRGAGGEEMEVEFQHNCWKHDQDLLIRYVGVSSFILDPADGDRGTDLRTVILDEILPHRDGCSHEIACWDGTLTLVCRDLQATWIETTCSSKS